MTSRTETNGLKKYLVGVAVSITITLVVQTGALIWWASGIDKDVKYMRRDVDCNTARVDRIEKPLAAIMQHIHQPDKTP